MVSALTDPKVVDAAALEASLSAAAEDTIQRKAIPKALLQRAKPWSLVRDATVDWLIIGALWLAMGHTPVFLYPLWALLVAGRLHAFGVLLHDACHMPPRPTWGHRVLNVIAGYPLGITTNAMRYHHLRHHRDNGMSTDPYFKADLDGSRILYFLMWIRGVILVPFWLVGTVFGAIVSFLGPGRLRHLYGVAVLQDRSGTQLDASEEVLLCAREERGKFVVYAIIISISVGYELPYMTAVFVPQLIAGLLSSYRLLVEHRYVPVLDRKISSIFRTTYDHNLSWVSRPFLAPKNIGYHIIHHIHPQVSWRSLPRVRDWYKQQYKEQYPAPIQFWPPRRRDVIDR